MKKLQLLIATLTLGAISYGQVPIVNSWTMNYTGYNASYWDDMDVLNTMGADADCQSVCFNQDSVWVEATGLTTNMGVWTNPGGPSNMSHVYRFPRTPVIATTQLEAPTIFAIGTLVNGIPIFGLGDDKSYDIGSNSNESNGNGIWFQEAKYSEGSTLDTMGCHPNQDGTFHTHVSAQPLWEDTPTTEHSPIIGFAFDGLPIYGPYGYSDPLDSTSAIARMETSYQLRTMTDRNTLPDGTMSIPPGPSDFTTFPLGTYIEDYEYVDGLGDLDSNNTRFCITPEYPEGTWAYFTTIDGTGEGQFPYFVGPYFKGEVDQENLYSSTISVSGGDVCLCSNSPDITDIAIVDATCNGAADGSLTITATSIGAGATYSIDNGSTYQSSNAFTGLAAGTYEIIVLRASGCGTITTAVVSEANAVTHTSISTDENCGAADGQLDLTGAGGDGGPYSYSIDGGITFQGSGTFTGLAAGSYSIIVEDGSGCQSTSTESVNSVSGPSIDSSIDTDPTCNGDSNGSIDLTVSGGTGSINYSNDNGVTFQAGSTFSGLAAGTYNIVVEDASGCQTTSVVTLTDPAVVSYSASNTDDDCGTNAGEIILSGSGGSGGPFSYSIDGGTTYQSSGTFSGLAGTSYSISVLDGAGCEITGTETLGTGAAPSITGSTDVDPTCNGDSDGSIDLAASGGTGMLNYSVDNGTTFQTSSSFSGLSAGTYNVVVEDASGCQSTTTITLNDPALLTVTGVVTDETTPPGSNGAIDITVSGGTGMYMFDWDNDGTGDMDDSEDLSGLTTGTYVVEVHDANHCTATESFFVDHITSVAEASSIELVLFPNPATDIVKFNRIGNYNVSIFDASGKLVLNQQAINSIDVSNLVIGVYQVRITDVLDDHIFEVKRLIKH